MAIKRVFKNTMPGTQYLFRNGKSAQFVNGRYETDVDAEIAELDAEIAGGIPHIYVDPAETVVDTGKQDYVRDAQIKAAAKALKEYEEAQANGTVVNGVLAKEADGTVVKPGASEAQRVQTTPAAVPVGPIGAAKEVPVTKTNAVVLPVPKVPTPQTGIASSANAVNAAQSAS